MNAEGYFMIALLASIIGFIFWVKRTERAK